MNHHFDVEEIHIPSGDFEHEEDSVYSSNIWASILGAIFGMVIVITLLVVGKIAGIP